ncbi:hypothetical protein OHA84_01010 [Streptomyces sp. NBC_00513]|nr:hypothetical protein [Streptomyces sp. NBC_00424]MCX5079290.1 hypothetical protein [Streptomyces sp. NBC_00424]WUD39195.1 hypothetical protein OHA84_01010 [Streptomyces sp. NBC_00513]
MQHFGYPETLQTTTEGVIRTKYWSGQRYGRVVLKWAAQAHVELSDDTVD